LAAVVQAGGALDSDRDRQRGDVYVSIVVQADDLLIVPGSVRVNDRSRCATSVWSVAVSLDDPSAVGPYVDSPVYAGIARDGRSCGCELMLIVIDPYPR
jgi:hypothetical protein